MASRRMVRRLIVTGVLIAGAALAVMNPGVVKAFYQDIYPSDPAKRQALELCFIQDHQFNRLDSEAREACYHRMLQSVGGTFTAADGTPEQPAANLVDLQRAAGQRNLSRNDVRRLEQNEHTPHSAQ